MTLLEFIRKLQTPEGRLECATTYGDCKERLTDTESDNFDLREEIKALKFERDRIDKTEELTKRLYTEKLVNEALNMEIEGLRKAHAEEVNQLKEKFDLTKRQFADTLRSGN